MTTHVPASSPSDPNLVPGQVYWNGQEWLRHGAPASPSRNDAIAAQWGQFRRSWSSVSGNVKVLIVVGAVIGTLFMLGMAAFAVRAVTSGAAPTPSAAGQPFNAAERKFLADGTADQTASVGTQRAVVAYGWQVCSELGAGSSRVDVMAALVVDGISVSDADSLIQISVQDLCPQRG